MRYLVLRSLVFGVAVGGFSVAAVAEELDMKNGEKLHNENCISCHQSMFDGNADFIYTRENRRVADMDQLHNQVQRCSLNLRLDWFDSEMNNVSGYLDQQFYQFTPATEMQTEREK